MNRLEFRRAAKLNAVAYVVFDSDAVNDFFE